jgi:hypothetical protein
MPQRSCNAIGSALSLMRPGSVTTGNRFIIDGELVPMGTKWADFLSGRTNVYGRFAQYAGV